MATQVKCQCESLKTHNPAIIIWENYQSSKLLVSGEIPQPRIAPRLIQASPLGHEDGAQNPAQRRLYTATFIIVFFKIYVGCNFYGIRSKN